MGTIIHVRLRDDIDDDVAAWYEAQLDKSQYVRNLIQADMAKDGDSVTGVVTAVAEALPSIVGASMRQVMGELQAMVTVAVREVLASGQVLLQAEGAGEENAELAARLDEQLGNFFEEE